MNKNTLLKKGLVFGIIVLFVGVGVQPVLSLQYNISLVKNDKIESENIGSIQSGNKLTRKHIFPILLNYYFIESELISKIIKEIIKEIIFSGDASIDEIQEFVNETSINVDGIYLFPKIETTKTTDGELYCYPGNFLANLFGYNSKGSYVRYKTWYLALYGWYLKINGDLVVEKGGHLIGYYGYVRSCYDVWSYPPGDYNTISINGYSILVFHGI